MSTTKEIYITTAGLAELDEELRELKEVRRPEVINALKEARSLGDLSENAEYDSARDAQAHVESRIQEIEAILEQAIVVTEVKTDKVDVGTKVKLRYLSDNEIEEYSIVGISEADPFANKISNESPIARAIMGLKVGSKVNVSSPNGEYSVEIMEIS